MLSFRLKKKEKRKKTRNFDFYYHKNNTEEYFGRSMKNYPLICILYKHNKGLDIFYNQRSQSY